MGVAVSGAQALCMGKASGCKFAPASAGCHAPRAPELGGLSPFVDSPFSNRLLSHVTPKRRANKP
jgi:hypothetical protein